MSDVDKAKQQSSASDNPLEDAETPYHEPPKENSKQDDEKVDKVETSQQSEQESKSNKLNEKVSKIKGVLTLDFGPPDPKYDELWGSPRSFTEEKFANHFVVKRKWVQIVFSIIFYINLIISVVLFCFTDPAARKDPFKYKGKEIPREHLYLIGLYSVGTSVGVIVILLLMLFLMPGFFIIGTFGFAVLVWACVLVLMILGGNIWSQILFSVMVVFSPALFLLKVCRRIAFSTCVLKSAILVARKYPSTFFFTFIMIILQTAVNYMYNVGVTAAFYHGVSPWVYVYVIWSYFFITASLRNFSYCVVAGVASCWYFLNGSEWMPPAPLLASMRHMLGPTFGPVCLGGLIQSFCDTINNLNDTPASSPIYCIVKCMCMCLKCIVIIVCGIVNRFALIYCAMFGVDTKNAVKRWSKQKSRKMVNQCILKTIIESTFGTYSYISSSLCGAVASYFAYKKWGKGSTEFNFATVTATFFGKQAVTLLAAPIMTMSDALFVGFGEAPQRLDSGASEIMDLFDEENKKLFREEIDEEYYGKKKEGCCGCC